jgi:hypothetical protein
MREQAEQLAQRGAPNVSGLIEHLDGKLEFPRQLARAQVHNVPKAPAAAAYCEMIDPAALVAWLFTEKLIAALDREISSESDDNSALSVEARAKAEAEVMVDLLAVEFSEAALVWQAQSQNLPIEHRSDCAACAILQCQLITAPASNGQGTSPVHAITFAGAPR